MGIHITLNFQISSFTFLTLAKKIKLNTKYITVKKTAILWFIVTEITPKSAGPIVADILLARELKPNNSLLFSNGIILLYHALAVAWLPPRTNPVKIATI